MQEMLNVEASLAWKKKGLKQCGHALQQGPVSRKSRKLAIRKTPTRLLCKAGLFICCKGVEN